MYRLIHGKGAWENQSLKWTNYLHLRELPRLKEQGVSREPTVARPGGMMGAYQVPSSVAGGLQKAMTHGVGDPRGESVKKCH